MISQTIMPRRVLAIFNTHSGLGIHLPEIFRILGETWDDAETYLSYQESRNPADGQRKVRQAVADGVDTVIVIGGDGMVNTIGAELVGTGVAMAVLPTGSGNGFARHFGIPLQPERAARVLRCGIRQRIDVGYADNRPFFVTMSLAWDADVAKGIDLLPIRGVLPYVFAGIYHFFTYEPQNFDLEIDGVRQRIEKPLVLTAANLTQFGGGAIIAPDARPDDGKLSLIAIPRMETIEILKRISHLFNGTIHSVPEIRTFTFQRMNVRRDRSDPIQLDGELVTCEKDFTIEVKPYALDVIVPAASYDERSQWSVEESSDSQ